MTDRTPTHLLANAGDRVALCGARGQPGKAEPPLPCVLVEHAASHVAGWGMIVCAPCDDARRAAS